MNIQTIKATSTRVRSPVRSCCDDKCPSGARNNWFLGKRLTPDSYRIEQDYAIERRRLLNRAIHGWGVVYGFALTMMQAGVRSTLEPGELAIGEGLALDRLGRELIETRGTVLTLDNLIILDEKLKPVRVEGCDLGKRLEGLASDCDCWLLSAHYAEQVIERVKLKDPCSCDRVEWDRTCETIAWTIRRIDCQECCAGQDCELDCCCPQGSLCCSERDHARDRIADERRTLLQEHEKRLQEAQTDPGVIEKLEAEYQDQLEQLDRERIIIESERHPRGGCSCLCEHLGGLTLDPGCARLSDIGDCTRADLANGVALACLRLERNACDEWAIAGIADACGPRRLVKRNDLLFDLINGCDVTRISKVGWALWHRREEPVPFDAFVAALGWDGDSDYAEYPTRDFWVRFSRPVRIDTLRPDAFAMVVMSDHGDDFWRRSYRVPILEIDTDLVTAEPGDPPGYARSARIVVATAWLRNLVEDDDTIFAQGETRVEIEVRGDLIEDCLGQMVDANARGRSPFPSGTDGPGDAYLSAFTVKARKRRRSIETRPPPKGRRPQQPVEGAAS